MVPLIISSSPQIPDTGWLRPAGVRLLTWWPVKLTGSAGGMTLFFTVYFWVLEHPLASVTIMPLTAVDRWIGFQPGWLPVYLSLWIYVSLAPALLINRRALISLGLAWVALSVIGLGFFLRWPTAVRQSGVDWVQYPHFAFLKSVDAAGNACPSLHVAFAVFSAVSLGSSLRELGAGRGMRRLNWLWCFGILYSTMATGQHVALDVLGGTALGVLVAAVHLRWLLR